MTTMRCGWKHAVAGMALAPALACAQMYQCAGPEGRPVVTDKPCDATARPLDLPPPVQPTYDMEVSARTRQKLDTPLRYQYYEIRGTTLADLQQQLRANAREARWTKSALATTTPKWDVRYGVHSDGRSRCSITGVSVVADSTVWIPRWANEQEAPQRVRDIVNAFLANVAAHEQGHVGIHVESGQEMVLSLRAIAPASSREEIRAEAETRAAAIMRRSVVRQDDYDRRAKEGTQR